MEVGNLFVKLNLDMSGLQRGLEQAKTQVAGLGDRLQSAMKAAEPGSKALAASLAAVGAATGALGLKAIKMAGQMEQSRIAFTTMLGSAEAADAFLRELYDFAARTPFEIEGLQQSARQLLAFGFHAQEIIPMMEAIGNAVSGLGGGAVEIERVVRALGQMQAKGKVTAEEMMQLAELGIPVWDILAEKIGVSIPEAMDKASKGGISAAEGINALLEGMNERFPDMMQKQSDSLLGIWSNFEDNVSMILTRIGDDLIETFNLKGKLKSAVEALEHLRELIGEEGLQGVFDQLSTSAKTAIAAIAGAITAALIPAFVALATAIWGAMAPLLPFMAVGAAIAALAYTIYKAWSDNMFGIQDKVKTTGAVISSAFQVAVASIMTAFNKLKEVVYRILQSIMNAVEPLVGVLGKIAPSFESAFDRAQAALKTKGDAASKEAEKQAAKLREAAASLQTSAAEMREAFSSWSTPGATAGFGDFRIIDKPDVSSVLGLGAAGESISDTMSKVAAAGSKVAAAGSKAAQTLKAAWEATAESLKNRLAQVKTAFEIKGNQLDITGNKAQQLRNDIDSLTAQIEIQKQIIEATNEGYEQMKAEKGENSEEAQKLKLKLLEEQKALSDLQKQLYDTTNALKDHAQEFRDLAAEIDKVEQKYKDDLAAALEDYQRKVEEVNRRVREEERRTTDEYNRAVEERTRALSNFVGLFDQVARRDVSGETLLANLRGQVSAFENWSKNIQALAARGVDEGLIEELRQMGPKAGPEIAALNTLTDEQLAEYVTLWKRKNEEARAEAINQLQQQRVEMQQKLMEIRKAANEQLELYRVEWEKKNAEIRKNAEEEMKRIEEKFQSIAKAGTTYGVQLVANFTAGMESQFDRLRKTLENMAMTVDAYMPHSPAKQGPLKRLNEWGPALVGGLVEGIKRSLPSLESVTARMAMLSPGALQPAVANSYRTSKAIKDQGKTAKDLVAELKKVAETYQADLAKALEEYQQKVKDTNDKLAKDMAAARADAERKMDDIAAKGADRERQVTEQFQKELDNRVRSLMNFVGLFDEVTHREVSGETLLRNLEDQVDAFENWQENIAKLSARGIDEGLLQELRDMGPKAGSEIAALKTLTDAQLGQYTNLWRQKEVARKLEEMQAKASEELEKYKQEWEKKNEEIKKNTEKNIKDIHDKFNDLVGKSTGYGVSLIENFMAGIDSAMPGLISKLDSVADTIDSYMPHSPAKVGPLKRLAEWGPALVNAFADGIKASLPKLGNAVAGMAALTPAAVGPSISNSTSNNYGGNVFHITVTGGSTREQAEGIMRELHRLGVRF